MRWSCLLRSTAIGVCVLSAGVARADGLFYQLPEDGCWVRFDLEYTYKVDGPEKPGEGTGALTMASVGKTVAGAEPCRWIEFKVRLKDIGPEQILIRKLLIPEKYLKQGENPTEHVVRGWAKFLDEEVQPAIPVHGRWPAYLAGPLRDQTKLETELVESKLGALQCDGVAGWIQYEEQDVELNKEGDITMKVTFETRLHEQAPFGVVSCRMQFEMQRNGKVLQTVDAMAKLSDFGKDAKTSLPDHR